MGLLERHSEGKTRIRTSVLPSLRHKDVQDYIRANVTKFHDADRCVLVLEGTGQGFRSQRD
jgi:hypothetical protein